MPTLLRYLHLDVFTSTPLEGNQLAVFPDPPALDTDLMQRIAAEMAFSESTFIYPPSSGGNARMRIFTPAEELPMAGHPTIGSTFALAEVGRIPPGQERFVFELGVGPIDVSLEWGANGLSFAWMTQLLPAFGPKLPNRDELALALGVELEDLDGDHPAEVVSCGVPFLFLPLRSRAAVDRVSIDRRALTKTFTAAGVDELAVFVFTTDKGDGQETVYSRMLAPAFGIAEDPATGSASGPLGAYLFRHGLVPRDRLAQFVSLQGVKMLRPSRIYVSIEGQGDDITRVRVGGRSVLVGEGQLHL